MTTTDIEWTPEKLDEPLRWRKPQRVFVNSMSDLFHEDVPFDFIDKVFAIMGAARQHVFQVLTKRPDRMQRYMTARARCGDQERPRCWMIGSAMRGWTTARAGAEAGRTLRWHEEVSARGLALQSGAGWPLPNVWLGVSVEDQQRADERIPLLLSTPAAVRFLSMEPLLGPVDLAYAAFNGADSLGSLEGLHWVIVGGESGPGARPCHVDWIRDLVVQCRTASVPVFVKQLADKEGGDTSEWPSDLRVREFPEVRSVTTTKPPAEVWLQWYGENLDGLAPEPNHAPAEGTVTWYSERVYDSDVGPYVLDSAGLRARAEKAEAERDEERRQRQVEAELAREAIENLRAVLEPWERGHEADESERWRSFEGALEGARAWLDERVKV